MPPTEQIALLQSLLTALPIAKKKKKLLARNNILSVEVQKVSFSLVRHLEQSKYTQV
jgi:hypothetical protein